MKKKEKEEWKKKKKVVGFIPTKFLCMRSQIGVIARIMETFVLGKTETSSSDSPFTIVVINHHWLLLHSYRRQRGNHRPTSSES
jgi:hypothetical protein